MRHVRLSSCNDVRVKVYNDFQSDDSKLVEVVLLSFCLW